MTFIETWEAYQRKLEDRRMLARLARMLDRLAEAPPREPNEKGAAQNIRAARK